MCLVFMIIGCFKIDGWLIMKFLSLDIDIFFIFNFCFLNILECVEIMLLNLFLV